jgi:hypothetical protein
MSIRNTVAVAKAISAEIASKVGPPEEGVAANTQQVIMMSMVRDTRGYVTKIANQINGAYEHGWYDACAVMIRRLIETLIIECFEHHKIAETIKTPSGDFMYLRDLIDKAIKETAFNLGRNTKTALPKLKDIGDKSAHSRYYVALRGDIQPLLLDIRNVVQELLFVSTLKK